MCDPIWHMISRSGVVISITNCYIRVYFTLHVHCTVVQHLYGNKTHKNQLWHADQPNNALKLDTNRNNKRTHNNVT